MGFIVKDPSLKPIGMDLIDWAEDWMPILKIIREELIKEQALRGIRIGACLHIEGKTAVLVKTLTEAGARVYVCASNPESTQDAVAAALSDYAYVYAWRGETEEEYMENIRRVLDNSPNIIIDDGADLTITLHREKPENIGDVYGVCEETTTGVRRLRNLERNRLLRFPAIAVNDAMMKYLFDNRYGTGESVIFGFLNATNTVIAGKTVVVAGYGWVGRGIALRFRGMGANVIITEVNPIRAVEACMDGFKVMRMIDAIKIADIVITATGNIDVVTKEHLKNIKDKCILANAGHFDVEVSVRDLEEEAIEKKDMRFFQTPYNTYMVRKYRLKNGKIAYLLGKGRLVNLACGQGHAAEIMDLSFSLQAECVKYLIKNRGRLEGRVYRVPYEIDVKIAELKLKTLGVEIDKLTKKQEEYIESWLT
ncbi:MAG: adenosylhomocysteinase [Candidatus Methanomethylicia archaeon]